MKASGYDGRRVTNQLKVVLCVELYTIAKVKSFLVLHCSYLRYRKDLDHKQLVLPPS